MKKGIRLLTLACAVLLAGGLLSGCSAGEEAKVREKAEQYAAALERNRNVSDKFTVSADRIEIADRAMGVPVRVMSETYGESFTVWVHGDDEAPTDTYYSLYLRQEAEEKAKALTTEVLGSGMTDVAVSFLPMDLAAVSAHAAGSIEEFMKLAGSAGVNTAVWIRLKNPEQSNPETEAVDRLIAAIREKGWDCRLYPYVSDAVWFDILPDACYINKQTADGGAYIKREPYTPAVPAGN